MQCFIERMHKVIRCNQTKLQFLLPQHSDHVNTILRQEAVLKCLSSVKLILDKNIDMSCDVSGEGWGWGAWLNSIQLSLWLICNHQFPWWVLFPVFLGTEQNFQTFGCHLVDALTPLTSGSRSSFDLVLSNGLSLSPQVPVHCSAYRNFGRHCQSARAWLVSGRHGGVTSWGWRREEKACAR